MKYFSITLIGIIGLFHQRHYLKVVVFSTNLLLSFIAPIATTTLLLGWTAGNAQAQTVELESIRVSSDISASLPFTTGGTITGDDDSIYVYNVASMTADAFGFFSGALLGGAEVDAHHMNFFSFDAIVVINDITIFPNDITNSFGQKTLDGRATGIPVGVNIDAFSFDPASDDLIISIDIPANINGSFFLPDDLIRFDGTSYSLFDSLSTHLNLDAFHILSNQEVLVSFATGGVLPNGLRILDDDILRWNPALNSYSFELLISSVNDSWFPADVDALFAREIPPVGQFAWTTNFVEVFEDDPPAAAFPGIRRTDGSAGPVTVNIVSSNGSATAGSDYTAINTTVTFADGQTFATFNIDLIDDAIIEGNEEFFIDLTTVSDGSLGSPTRIRVLIRDDEDFLFADSFEDPPPL